jgi:hypothetical protein
MAAKACKKGGPNQVRPTFASKKAGRLKSRKMSTKAAPTPDHLHAVALGSAWKDEKEDFEPDGQKTSRRSPGPDGVLPDATTGEVIAMLGNASYREISTTPVTAAINPIMRCGGIGSPSTSTPSTAPPTMNIP